MLYTIIKIAIVLFALGGVLYLVRINNKYKSEGASTKEGIIEYFKSQNATSEETGIKIKDLHLNISRNEYLLMMKKDSTSAIKKRKIVIFLGGYTLKSEIYYIIIFLLIGMIVYMYKSKQTISKEEDFYMQENLDRMIGLDKLELYYEAHMVGIDGECFNYNIYFKDMLNDEKVEEIKDVIEKFKNQYNDNDDSYIGYIDVSKDGNRVNIYLDLGNVSPNYENISIQGILKAINNVEGIKQVLINEDAVF